MAKTNYIERVNSFIVPYLAKNGYELIKTEFVTEDNNNYLRLYIDLAADELAKREAKAAALREENETVQDAEAAKESGKDADNAAEQTDTAAHSADEAENMADNAADTADEDSAAAEDSEEPVVPGVSINDCVKVSRYLSKWLDKEDFIKEMYTMEVCSKGFLNEAVTSEG